jgi:hypothetical protein
MRWAIGIWVISFANAVAAQAPPGGDQHSEHAAEHEENDVRFTVSAGTTLTYGNARSLGVNLASEFILRLDQHAFTAQVGWIYAIASQRDTTTLEFGPWTDSTNNATWKLRYDFFITPDDAVFIAHRGRYDPFAQLTPRIGGQLGYLRNFVREDKHRLWGEIGYDFTYDRFPTVLAVGVDAAGMPILSRDRALHSLRLFVGYDNRLNDLLTYTTGLEALMTLDHPEHWRFEWTNQLRSKIEDWLLISLDVTLRLDSQPPGQRVAWNEEPMQPAQMFDMVATLNVVGTFDLYPNEEEPECPVCPEPEPCPEHAAEEAEAPAQTPP